MTWDSLAVCDQCWKLRNPSREAHRLVLREEETCCHCGMLTTSGIYVRENTDTVAFPPRKKRYE